MFAKPNYTQTPNEFFDNVAKNLKNGELRIFLVIMRQTFGWQKKWDRISRAQLAKKTGLHIRSVSRSVNSLIKKGLVEKIKNGPSGRENCWYALVVEQEEIEDELPDYPQNSIDNSNNLYGCHNVTPGCHKDTHKRNNSSLKRKYRKEKESPPDPQGGHSTSSSPSSKESFGKHVKLSKEELEELVKEHGKETIDETIEDINLHIDSKGAKYKDFSATIKNWIRREKKFFHGKTSKNPSSCQAQEEKNHKIAEKIAKKFPKLVAENKISINRKAIFFPMGSSHPGYEIKFTENGFVDQVFNILRKMKLPIEGLLE